MSRRLGAAIAQHIRELPGTARFVLVEGVSEDLAAAITAAWSPELPPLAVAARHPSRFGAYALQGTSGTGLRNRHAEGVCLVVCEGEQLPDRQSLRSFENVAPSDLLASPEGIASLARAAVPTSLDGPAAQVRRAILTADVRERPSVAAVAGYFDALAANEDPLRALPRLGAFADHAQGGRVDMARITENFRLAARRRSDELLRPATFAETRQRARRVLAQRVGNVGAEDAAAHFVALLQSGSDELLSFVTFDEAREILERRVPDLSEQVKRELQEYERSWIPEPGDPDIRWDHYRERAEALRRTAERQEAARNLLEFDDVEHRAVFQRATRKKLEGLTRDRVIRASTRSCPEAALVRGVLALQSPLAAVRVVGPQPPPASATSRTAAQRALTLAAARLRLGALFRLLQADHGVEVDGLLLREAGDGLWEEAFDDASLAGMSSLPVLQLKLAGRQRNDSVQIDWSPDFDDVAALRLALVFAAQPALTISCACTASLAGFCDGSSLVEHPVPPGLEELAGRLQKAAAGALANGLSPALLAGWTDAWRYAVERAARAEELLEPLALAGAVVGADGSIGLGALAPMKAEWLGSYLEALWQLVANAVAVANTGADPDEPLVATASGIERSTAAHYPAFMRLRTRDQPLLPSSEARVWSVYGGPAAREDGRHAAAALGDVLERLLVLQPEAAGHLRCVAWGPGAADLLIDRAVGLLGRTIGRAKVEKVELFCIGEPRPRWETLANADNALAGEGREALEVRYLSSLDEAHKWLRHPSGTPGVHLALFTGLTMAGQRLRVEAPEVPEPAPDDEVLFAPRTWMRPGKTQRLLLMPPGATMTGLLWLRLMTAMDDSWPDDRSVLQIPEVQTAAKDLASQLRLVHDIAMWVATLDRYATRDSLEAALGADVAILHQERRLGGESPVALVISQKSGGPADRAIGRSLRNARILSDPDAALAIGEAIRKVASQGYGILALEAATTGAGINELVGHVVAFSLLAARATPWPLPPGCRVLLVSLDEYGEWFPSGRRADLLALAIDTQEGGLHVATIEVKARRSDAKPAADEALEQLRQTLLATRYAAYPVPGSLSSRLWLNRIAEAAYSVARESQFRLSAEERDAIERFRRGAGTLEWAGIGLVFGPAVEEFERHVHQPLADDRVPIVIHTVRLTEDRLRKATAIRLADLRTVEAERAPLEGGRAKRRPEAGSGRRPASRADTARPDDIQQPAPETKEPARIEPAEQPEAAHAEPIVDEAAKRVEAAPSASKEAPAASREWPFDPPVLGWDSATGEPLRWHAAGPQAALPNGHIEVWGSSGAGKTQFAMSLLAQLARGSGARFGIADFKNDYGGSFPGLVAGKFVDLWEEGAPYNPLALQDDSPRAIEKAIIELRDTVDVATKAFTRMGHRQLNKLRAALEQAYEVGRAERRWPTLRTLDDLLDADLAGVIGDLTRHEIFKDGPPLGDAVAENIIFGLSQIPGNGLTTILAAGFILSALLLKLQGMSPVSNTIRYAVVVDEAHRVADFRAIDTMVREGRSKGLAVLLATQQPGDLPDVVAANAQTKICFRLPDATAAAAAARRLDPGDPTLPAQIRTLEVGEAFVSLGGATPRLLSMAQFWRDRAALDLPE